MFFPTIPFFAEICREFWTLPARIAVASLLRPLFAAELFRPWPGRGLRQGLCPTGGAMDKHRGHRSEICWSWSLIHGVTSSKRQSVRRIRDWNHYRCYPKTCAGKWRVLENSRCKASVRNYRSGRNLHRSYCSDLVSASKQMWCC